MIRAAISRLVMGPFPQMGGEAWHVSDLPYVSIPDALSYKFIISEFWNTDIGLPQTHLSR